IIQGCKIACRLQTKAFFIRNYNTSNIELRSVNLYWLPENALTPILIDRFIIALFYPISWKKFRTYLYGYEFCQHNSLNDIHKIFLNMKPKYFIYSIAFLGLAACATNPFTGKKTLALVGDDTILPMSFQQYNQF